MAKAMTRQAKHIHNAGRRRYYDSSTRTAIRVVPLRSAATMRSLKPRRRATSRSAQSHALGTHVGVNTVSANSYKSSHVLWFEADVAQPGPVSSSLGFSSEHRTWPNEHRTSRSTKEDLVAVLRRHIGSWVAIRGSSVIVSRNSPLAVVSFLREHNLRADSIFRVPKDARQEIPGEA